MPQFRTKPINLEAVQLRGPARLGTTKARAGDWLVTHADGRQEIVVAKDFATLFEPIILDALTEAMHGKNGNGAKREREREPRNPPHAGARTRRATGQPHRGPAA